MENRCSLCDGRITKGKCTQCGMDFSRRKKEYNLNVNGRSAILEEPPKAAQKAAPKPTPKTTPRPEVKVNQQTRTGQQRTVNPARPQKQVKTAPIGFRIVVGIIVLVVAIGIPFIEEVYEEYRWRIEDYSVAEDRDWYADTEKEPLTGGESYTGLLESGNYIVGKHIPEGTYQVTITELSGWFDLDDRANSIYISQSLYKEDDGSDSDIAEDIRLYEGAQLQIHSAFGMEFKSENAQLQNLKESQENPLTQEVNLEGDLVAGENFEPGTYDVVLDSGDVSLEVYDKDEYYVLGIFLNEGEYGSKIYKNIEFEEGSSIVNGDPEGEEFQVRLVPSEAVYP